MNQFFVEQLCKLLEADLVQRGGQRQRGSMMSYEIFRQIYWPHFPQSLIKGLGTFSIAYAFRFSLVTAHSSRSFISIQRVYGSHQGI
jgi:hypothetical protein